ncbi:MAG TPA: hypothetical protein VLH58_09320, partial [Candidatus Methylomirabilis sp.]|nr:hypothetical protein [Candidatus Methylomirabilis sp.]
MALTQYPIVTDQSTVQVTLPPGRHTLELVVEDSAGMQSAPDTVIITVVREAPLPRISGITPTSALAGATLDAVIAGDNLDGATAVRFSGTGITAQILPGLIPTIRPTIGPILEATVLPTIRPTLEPPIPVPPTLQPGGTGSQLQVRLTIDPGAPVGPRSFAVTTPAGVAESPSGVTFSVIRFIPPTIEPTIFPTIEPTIRPTLEPTILP